MKRKSFYSLLTHPLANSPNPSIDFLFWNILNHSHKIVAKRGFPNVVNIERVKQKKFFPFSKCLQIKRGIVVSMCIIALSAKLPTRDPNFSVSYPWSPWSTFPYQKATLCLFSWGRRSLGECSIPSLHFLSSLLSYCHFSPSPTTKQCKPDEPLGLPSLHNYSSLHQTKRKGRMLEVCRICWHSQGEPWGQRVPRDLPEWLSRQTESQLPRKSLLNLQHHLFFFFDILLFFFNIFIGV